MNYAFRMTPIFFFALAFEAGAQQRPAIRQLGAISAKSSETFANVAGVRPLSNGAVLVNDLGGRRVVLFDAQLGKFTIVADSTSATANAYGGRIGSLIAYRADSTIFVDPTSVSMLVIDPAGKVARVMAIPRAEDAMSLGSTLGNSAVDASGRLIYRAGGGMRMMGRQAGGGAGPGALPLPEMPDSAFIVRIDLATRKLDTLGSIRTPKIKFETKQDENGNMSIQSMYNPLPVVDDWAVTPDGAIAFIRGRDYHVDWVNPDGTKTSSAKIPFDWKRMTDEDKVAFIDSLKAARERMGAHAPGALGGQVMGGGGPNVQISIMGAAGGAPRGGDGATRTRGTPTPQPPIFVPASELPDYQPAFFAGSTRADLQGNLWIRTIPTSAIAGGPVYDVINRKGEIVERVQIPEGRTIAGFGADGSVYLLNRQGTTSTLEKAAAR